MEAVPRMLMLGLELKESAERIEFGPVLKPYISQHYMEDENKYTEEIRQIDQLRINACNVTRDFNGISVLKKYYGQLYLLTSRFPMGEGGQASLPFTWMDTFDEEPFTHIDVAYEQACILYNLGSLHSILGTKESRSSEEEMKVACTHFQCAAGAFTYLRDHFQSDMSPDISFELMTIYINVMLGQAQECLLEKSMQDNRKSSLVARISIQVVDYYRQAMRGLDDSNVSSLLGSKKSKTWKKVLSIKMNHFTSIAYLFMSNQAEEQMKYGERVTYLQHAVDKHNDALKQSKGQHETIVDALNFTKDVVVGKFQSAKKDNDFVYHDTVPSIENLLEIKGASLVKALTFQPNDESVAGPDIFRKLVPMEAHEASSLYSEEKAKLLRKISSAIENKNKQLDQFVSALGVEQLKLKKQEPERLPQVLLEVCAAISVKQAPIKTLVNSMQALSSVVLDVDLAAKELASILEEEDKQEIEFQKEFGSRPTNVIRDLKKEFDKYQEGHNKASRSNQELHKAMEAHIQNIRSLAGPLEDLQALLPSNKDAEQPEDKEAESKLQKLLEKVEEMKAQRQTLEGQLREQLQKDDITSLIVTKEGGNMKDFFEEELKKHSSICTYIEQNLTAQDNILKAVTDANAAYADTRKMSTDISKKREDKIQELITSFTVYDDLIAKSHKGTEFYKKLEQGVTKLLSKTKGVVKVNQEERDAMIQKIRPKPAPARPTAPKPPPTTVDDTPRGPRLSDFWQPKTRGAPASSTPPSSPQPGMPSGVYPSATIGAAGQMYLGGPGPADSGSSVSHVPGGVVHGSIPASSVAGVNVIGITPGGHIGHQSPQHVGDSSSRLPGGGDSHPGAPGGQPKRVPTLTPDGHISTIVQPGQHNSGGGSPSTYSPGGIPASAPHQSPVHTAVIPQRRPIMQQPMLPQINNQTQPTQPINQSHPNQGVMTPQSSQQHYGPPNRPHQTQTSMTQAPKGNTVQPQQAVTSNINSFPATPDPVSRHAPSAGYISSSVPSGPNQMSPVASSSGHLPLQSGAAPSVLHQYSHPQTQPTQLPQKPPNAPIQQQFIPPQQSGQWQQHPNSQPKQTPPQSHGYGPQPTSLASTNESHPQTSMTMVSSNATPIATPVQQGTGQMQYTTGQVPPASGQPGLQIMHPTGMGQVNPQMPQQQMYVQQQQPYQQGFTAQQQQQQIRMQQPGVGIQQQQPFMQQPVIQHQQHPGTQHQQQPCMQHPGTRQQPGMKQPSTQQQQQVQQHMYHQHQQHSHVYQISQPPVSAQQEPVPQQCPQQTPVYGRQQQQLGIGVQNVQQPGPNTVTVEISQHQQVTGNFQHKQQATVQPIQRQQVSSVPVNQQQQLPSVRVNQQQQLPMGTYQAQPQQMVVQPMQQHTQPPIPAQAVSPVPQQHVSPQHQPGAAQQIEQNMTQLPYRTGSFDQSQQLQGPSLSNATSVQGYAVKTGGALPNQAVYHQQTQPIQQNQPQMPGSQTQQYALPPGGPGSAQCFSGQQSANMSQMNQQQPMGQSQAVVSLPQGQYSQGMPAQNMHQTNQPHMVQQQRGGQQTLQTGGPGFQQIYPNQTLVNQQQYCVQQPPGAPLTKSQQNKQINLALKEEQQKLPLPSLQPIKIETKPNDLLSSSPDSQQKSLSDVQLLQPQATIKPTTDQNSMSSTPAGSPTPSQTCISPLSIQSGPTKQSGHTSAEQVQRKTQPLLSEGDNSSGPKDPYGDKEMLDKFVEDVERFEKVVEGLSKQMLSGPTVMEKIWKELTDAQERDTRQYSMAVARCYSMKNRHPDIMPYDHNRVFLSNTKNDYVNASYIKDLSLATPQFIATQAPVVTTINDFWLMVYEQQITIIAALVSKPAGGATNLNFDQYWLEERGQVQTYGPIMLTMQSKRTTDFHTERIFNLMHRETRQMRTLFLLQFTAWHEFGVSSNPSALIQFIGEVNNYHKQSRRLQDPVLVHCKSGVSTTGVFCVLYTAIQEMQAGNGIIDIPQVVKNLRQQRKWMITDKEQLKFCYDAVLLYAEQMLAKRGLLIHNSLSSPAFDSKRTPSRLNSFDSIMGIDSVESLHTKISQMTVRRTPEPSEAASADSEISTTASAQHKLLKQNLGSECSGASSIILNEAAPQIQGEPLSELVDPSASTSQLTNAGLSDLNLGGELGTNSGLVSPDGSSSSSLSQLQENNLNFFSQSAQNLIPDRPDVVESNTATQTDHCGNSGSGVGSDVVGSNSSLPSILADLTPQNFSIKDVPASKQKVTKADFVSGKSKLGEPSSVDDPLGMLDPLWSVSKPKPDSNQGST